MGAAQTQCRATVLPEFLCDRTDGEVGKISLDALDTRDYAHHGGSFPIFLKGTGCVGTITVSGLPQREDHCLVVEIVAAYLQQDISDLSLSGGP